MTTAEFKKIARLLKKVYQELEQEAISEGISTLSPEYDQLVAKAREKVLESQGYTLQEYREAKAKVSGFSQADYVDSVEQHTSKLEELGNRHIPTSEEIADIAEEVAQKYIVPPQITNQIVKEYTIEKPRIIETTKQTIIKEKYNSKPIEEKLSKVQEQLSEIRIPDLEKFRGEIKEELTNIFQDQLENNINILDMPNFRKLAMGLQAQIDANAAAHGSSGVNKTGTPVNNQVAIWTNDTVIEGDSALTFDTATDTLSTGILNSTSLTASEIVITDASKNLVSASVATYPNLTELSYVKGVTSAIQTQLNSKGTVTTVSVVSANGLAGTVATDSTTPAITLSTTATGLLKGNGTAISAATAGTDYSAGTSALSTGILKSTTTTGALSIAVSGSDFKTINSTSILGPGNITASVINWLGAYNNATSYIANDAVSLAGNSYICILATGGGITPPNLTYWNILAQQGDPGAAGVSGALTTPFTGQTSVTVTHNFAAYPAVQIIDGTGAVIIPLTIVHASTNAFTVTFTSSTTGNIISTIGGVNTTVVTKSSNYSILSTDSLILCTASLTLTLPSTSGLQGKIYYIKNTVGAAVQIITTGGATIDGQLSQNVNGLNSTIQVITDGTNWFII